jgi:parallel beta-helix repeat protein
VRIQKIGGREALRTHHATFLACLLLAVVVLHPNVHPVFSSSTIYIRADGSIDPLSAPISTTNNITYTLTNNIYDEIVVEKNDIVINGASHTVEGSGTGNGFTLYSVTNVTLTNINIKNFEYGVYLESSSYNSINRNNISGNDYDGIEVYFSSDYNNITENRIEANGWYGVGILYSHNNTISANDIANNDDGIDAYDASGTEISKNRITSSGEFGIGLYSSSENAIFLNNFVNNTQHVYSEYSTNRWDEGYPSGGNYWSNYSGVDSKCGPNQDHPGADGIGDAPYTLDSNNTDRYPLIDAWTPPSGHDVAVISAVSYKTVIGQGFSGNITVYSANRGEYAETFNITIYADTIPFASKAVHLESGFTTNITLSWNTTGFAKGNYTMIACAESVLGETNISNNNFTGGWVRVSIVGDLTGGTPNPYDFVPDGKVQIVDISVVAKFFGQKVPPAPANCDVSGPMIGVPDGKVQIDDVATVSKHYGQHYP